jgi:hypothetical protein
MVVHELDNNTCLQALENYYMVGLKTHNFVSPDTPPKWIKKQTMATLRLSNVAPFTTCWRFKKIDTVLQFLIAYACVET